MKSIDTSEVVLIDLSSIAHPIWHTSTADPVPNAVKTKIVARVRALASDKAHVAVCCDAGRSFRHDLNASYKANRPPREEALHHQIKLACEALKDDGFPVWAAPGFEADDVIATAVAKTLAVPDVSALVVSSDKDLLQLVGPRVRVMSARDGSMFDEAAVLEKFGVRPGQMRDYLTLVGDSADNVKGAPGIGPTKARALLSEHGSLKDIYEVGPEALGAPPAVAKTLVEFQAQWTDTAALITLRDDAPIPFDDILQERVPAPARILAFEEDDDMDTDTVTEQTEQEQPPAPAAVMVRPPDVLAPAPEEWERQLEPRSMTEAKALAKVMFDSGLFSAYGTPQAVMSTVLAGRELGLTAMASLRAIHVVEGKPTLSADLIRALVLRSGKAKYFRCTERSATRATFETQRDEDPAFRLTFTIEEARAAWPKSEDAWAKSGWGKNPADMLIARASAKLARLVYPDVVHGLYLTDEMLEAREVAA